MIPEVDWPTHDPEPFLELAATLNIRLIYLEQITTSDIGPIDNPDLTTRLNHLDPALLGITIAWPHNGIWHHITAEHPLLPHLDNAVLNHAEISDLRASPHDDLEEHAQPLADQLLTDPRFLGLTSRADIDKLIAETTSNPVLHNYIRRIACRARAAQLIPELAAQLASTHAFQHAR